MSYLTKKPRYKTLHEIAKEDIYKKVSEFTTEQKMAFEAMIDPDAGNILLTGSAGTGKSFCVTAAIDYLRRVEGKTVAVTATTATAAQILSAVTLHRFFGFGIDLLVDETGKPTVNASAAVCSTDVLFTDEISMISCDAFISVYHSIQKANEKRKRVGKPPIRWICIGDMCQIPPPCPKDTKKALQKRLGYEIGSGFAFRTKEWGMCQFKILELTEVMRQKGKDEFIYHLNKIRMGDGDFTNWFNHNCSLGYNPDAITILPTNKLVKERNAEKLRELEGQEITYCAELLGNAMPQDVEKIGLDYELRLKKGCRVMIRCNPHKNAKWCFMNAVGEEEYIKYFCNGTTGIYRDTFVDENDGREYLFIELNNGQFVSIYKKQYDIYEYAKKDGILEKVKTDSSFLCYPCTLAYALTCHKAQGMSLSAINVLPTSFESGMLYVALSRVKGSAANIYLQDMVRSWDAILSDEVKEFYNNIREQKANEKLLSADS